jgi:hypothetical protein
MCFSHIVLLMDVHFNIGPGPQDSVARPLTFRVAMVRFARVGLCWGMCWLMWVGFIQCGGGGSGLSR